MGLPTQSSPPPTPEQPILKQPVTPQPLPVVHSREFPTRFGPELYVVFLFAFSVVLGSAMFVLYSGDVYTSLFILGVCFLSFALVSCLLPKRLTVNTWERHVRITYLTGWSWNLDLDNIMDAREAGFGIENIGSLKFSTSMMHRVAIIRRSGMNVIVSPQQPDDFILAVRHAIAGSPI